MQKQYENVVNSFINDETNKSFLNGQWVEGKSGRAYNILNPFDNTVITSINLATKEQLSEAFESAASAQKDWAKSSVEEKICIIKSS
jgi:aldehyde dehydrogenase (NAD+)